LPLLWGVTPPENKIQKTCPSNKVKGSFSRGKWIGPGPWEALQ